MHLDVIRHPRFPEIFVVPPPSRNAAWAPPGHPTLTMTKTSLYVQELDVTSRSLLTMLQIPESLLAKSYADVAAYLTKNARNDLDKVRAIFQWTASLDLPLVHSRTTELPEHGTPLDYLLRINWRLGNHANFIVHMARCVRCVIAL